MSNRMIFTDNPKTIARREQMRIKYANLDKNEDMLVHPSEIGLSSYYTIENHSIIISYESDLEGMYCDNPKLLYRNSNISIDNKTCLDIYWNCNDCMTCDKRRRLKIMKHLDKRFRYHTSLDVNGDLVTYKYLTGSVLYGIPGSGTNAIQAHPIGSYATYSAIF
ncbi:hypothetical protein LCGC14_2805450, partial [marine sediment metagenome]